MILSDPGLLPAALQKAVVPAEIGLVLFFLFAAAAFDLRTRRVPDTLWVLMGASAMPLVAAACLFDLAAGAPLHHFLRRAVLPLICLAAGEIMYRRRLIGGADVKAMILLAVIFPEMPVWQIGDITFPVRLLPETGFLPAARLNIGIAAVGINAVLLSSLWIPWCLFMNLKNREGPAPVRWYYPMIGYRQDISCLFMPDVSPPGRKQCQKESLFLMERIRFLPRRGAVRKTVLTGIDPAGGNEKEYMKNLRKAIEKGIVPKEQWVSPKIPFLLPMACGALTAFLIGDLPTAAIGVTARLISYF